MPKRLITEVMIQAEFYLQCQKLNLPVIMEYSTPAGRLDCCLTTPDYQRIIAIIEIKRLRQHIRLPQLSRYKSLGLPVFVINSLEQCETLPAQLKRDYIDKLAPGVSRATIAACKRTTRGKARKPTIIKTTLGEYCIGLDLD